MTNTVFFKRIKLFLAITCLSSLLLPTSLLAQRDGEHPEWGRMGSKIQQLEKIKIIEVLNLDEPTTLKFFSRRDQHMDSQRALLGKRDLLYDNLKESFHSGDETNYKGKIAEIFTFEKEMIDQREKFFNSLKDILSDKQIAELLVFESDFRDQIRHEFLKQGEKRKPRN